MSLASSIRSALGSVGSGVRHSAPRGRRYAGVRHVFSGYRGPSYSRGRRRYSAQAAVRVAVHHAQQAAIHSAVRSRLAPPSVLANIVASGVSGIRPPTFSAVYHAPRLPGRGPKSIQTPQRYTSGTGPPRGNLASPTLQALSHIRSGLDPVLKHQPDPVATFLNRGFNNVGTARTFGKGVMAGTPGVVTPAGVISTYNPKHAQAVGGFAQNAVKDTVQTVANAPAAVAHLGAAGVSAAGGNTRPLEQIATAMWRHDPVLLTLQGKFGKAAHEAYLHPAITAGELVGAKAFVGRNVGRVQRLAGAQRELPPARLEGTNVRVRRPLSPDAFTRARQVRADRKAVAEGRVLAQRANDAQAVGNLKAARELRAQARHKSPLYVSDRQIMRRMDERNHANEQVRRDLRAVRMRQAMPHVVAPKRGGHLQSLLAQAIVHPNVRSIESYLHDLNLRFRSGELTPAEAFANRATATELANAVKGVRAGKVNLRELSVRAKAYAREQLPLQQRLIDAGLLDPVQAERARLIPYAVRSMGARHDGERLVLPAQPHRELSNAAIKEDMRANGINPDEVAYLSQAPNARGAKNFYMNTLQRHGIPSAVRTGEATRNGTFDTHPQTFIEQAAREANLLAADHGFKGLVDEFAVRHPQGHDQAGQVVQFATRKEAQKYINNHHALGGRKLRPIRMNPFAGKQEDLQHLLEAVNQGADVPTNVLAQIDDALRQDASGSGPWALVHDAAANRMQQHLRLLGPPAGLRGLQRVNQAFRNAVLPLSMKWLTGNVVEAGFRAALTRAGPLSYLTGRRVFGRLDRLHAEGKLTTEQLLEARARTHGGGHYAMSENVSVHRGADQFENSVLRPVARALGATARAPGARQVGNLWRRYTHFVFSKNGLVEQQFQTAMAGRYVRDLMPTNGELSFSQKAVEQAAQGLRNTNEQVQMGRFVDRAYGKYAKFNPAERAAIAYYTPFVAWWLNAVKFVTDVLPRDHPVALGLLAASQRASDQWLKDHGLNLWMKGALPGFLQGTIPLSGDRHVLASRYLPFGAFTDPAQTVAQQLLPQYMSAVLALNGLDWKGDPLNGPGGGVPSQGQKFGSALEAFLSGTVPVLGQVEQVAAKKGPLGQRLQRQFNPFYPIQPSSRGGSAGDNGGVLKGGGSGGGSNGGVLQPGGAEGAPGGRGPALLPHLADTAASFFAPGAQLPTAVGRFTRAGASRGPATYKPRLFAHPQRAANYGFSFGEAGGVRAVKGAIAAATGTRMATVAKPAGPPSAVLDRFSRYGVKDPSGRVVVPATDAKKLIGDYTRLGYGHGQIVDRLALGKGRRQLGVPAQVVRAMRVLKGVKGGASPIAMNKSHYTPAEISKIAQHYGAPKWLGDALGRTSIPESGGNPRARSGSPNGGSWGLLQINQAVHTEVNRNRLWDPEYNVRAALYVMSKSGSGAWSGSGTWHDRPVAAHQFNFPNPANTPNRPWVHLNPAQKRAAAVAQRASAAWMGLGTGVQGPGKLVGQPHDRAGASTKPFVLQFAKALSAKLGRAIALGAGTNHSQMTTSGNQSQHWTGNAIDLPMSGAPLTQAGQAALELAGMPRAQARRQTGGVFNIGGYQILFNTTTGGNHFTHLHVGIKDGTRVPTVGGPSKGGPLFGSLPRPVRAFLRQYAPAPAASASPGGGGGAGGGVGGTGAGGGGGAAGAGGSAGSSAGLAALIKSLSGGSAPVSSALQAPWFATGPALAQVAPVRRKKSYI